MGKTARLLGCALFVAAFAGEGAARSFYIPKRFRIPTLTAGTTIDDIPPLISRFHSADKKPLGANTKVAIARRADALYVRFECSEPSEDNIVAKTTVHDGPVWKDDSVELDIDAANAKNMFYQIVVNTKGILYDAVRSPMDYEDASWTSHAKVKVKRQSNEWRVAIRIPLASLKIDRSKTSVIGMNFVRHRYAGAAELSAYRPTFLHTWVPRGIVPDSACFAEFVLDGGTSRRSHTPLRPYGKPSWPPIRVYSTKGELQKDMVVRSAQMEYSAMAWPFFLRRGVGRSGALKLGLEYDYHQRLGAMKAAKVLPLMTLDKPPTRDYNDLDVWAQELAKHGLQCAFTPNVSIEARKLGLIGPGFPRIFLPDARLKKFYTDQTDRAFRYYKDRIAVFFLGDEFYRSVHKAGLWLWWNRRKQYRRIELVDAQVREKFGFGKYSMPEDAQDKNPYRHIAYTRWVIDWCDRFERAVSARVRALSPGVLIMSDDHLSAIPAHDIGRWRYSFDIVAGQVYGKAKRTDLNWGWMPKFYADVSGCPQVWNCVHVEHYPASYSPREVQAILSEYFRAGGTGLIWYTVDVRGNGRMAMEEYYGAPDRWRYVTKIMRMWADGVRARKGRPRVGVLFSNPSQWGAYDGHVKSAYGLLGRTLGVDFKYFDDGNLRRGETDAAAFDVILVPYARYERFETGEKLLKAAKAGSTVVVCDPNAFSYDLDGSDLKLLRTKMCGDFSIGEALHAGSIALNSINRKVPTARRYRLKIPAGAKVAATFPDGSPAAFEIKAGAGSITWFAANPLTYYADEGWEAWWRNLFAQKGIPMDLKSWRITLPAPKPIAEPESLCLTGNAVEWRSSRPLLHRNVDLPGTYRFSLAPDRTGDQGAAKEDILFKRGDLCDRFDAVAVGGRLNDYIVSWNSQEEVAVDFDLTKPASVDGAVIFATGYIPEVHILTGASKSELTEIARIKGTGRTDKVARLHAAITSKTPVRYVRIVFARRAVPEPFTLAEIEIWGKLPTPPAENGG